MPKLGFNMDEGKLVKWYKSEGNAIKKGEPLFAIETDKTSIDVEATADGTVLALLIDEGDQVPVTLPIAIIGDSGEDISSAKEDALKQLNKSDSKSGNSNNSLNFVDDKPQQDDSNIDVSSSCCSSTNLKISPRARKLAEQKGILNNLNIQGTGFDGGICEKDVIAYIESGGATSSANTSVGGDIKASPLARKIADDKGTDLSSISGSGVNGKIMKEDVLGAKAGAKTDKPIIGSNGAKNITEVRPYSGIRKVIGDRMCESKFTAPHLYFTQSVNIEDLLKVRKNVNEVSGHKTSITDFIAKATILTLQKFPDMNASLVGDNIELYSSVNLGVAVAAPSGLIVPNVKESQNMSLVEYSKAAAELVNKARDGKLSSDEYTGGTFTISNLGMFGIEDFTAIINQPEIGILAVSGTKDTPVVVENNGIKEIAIKPIMKITLTVDHRVLDGLAAAEFVSEIKRVLENPVEILIR